MKFYWKGLVELFLFVAIGVIIFIFNVAAFVLIVEYHIAFGLLFILTIPSGVVWFVILDDKYM